MRFTAVELVSWSQEVLLGVFFCAFCRGRERESLWVEQVNQHA